MKWKRTKGGYERSERKQPGTRRKKQEMTGGDKPDQQQTSVK
jgi:hypothetical protein